MMRESPFRPALVLVGIFTCLFLVAPTLIVIPMSFTESRIMQFPPMGFSTRWFEAVLTDPAWFARVVASLEVGIGSALLATALGVVTALGIVRGRFRGRGALSAIVLFPLVVPTVVIAIGMYFVWIRGWGAGPIHIGGGLAGTLPGLILAHAVLNMPLPVVTVAASLMTMDRNLELAAASLGADPLRTFRRVTVPLIMPGILIGFIFAFLGSWDEFVVSSFLVSPAITTVPVGLFTQVKFAIDPSAAAVSSLLLLMSTIVLASVLLRARRTPLVS